MIGPTDLLHPSPTPHFKTFQVFLIYCPNRPSFSTIQKHAPNAAFRATSKRKYIYSQVNSAVRPHDGIARYDLDSVSLIHLVSDAVMDTLYDGITTVFSYQLA
jgi:hypothetical protein